MRQIRLTCLDTCNVRKDVITYTIYKLSFGKATYYTKAYKYYVVQDNSKLPSTLQIANNLEV